MTYLQIIRGTTSQFTIVVKQSGTAVNLTGKQLVFVAGANPQITKKTGVSGSGFTITDATNGTASLEFTVTESRSLNPNDFPFTIELWESNGSIQTLIVEGQINVKTVVNVDA
jgi:hypothetical protein